MGIIQDPGRCAPACWGVKDRSDGAPLFLGNMDRELAHGGARATATAIRVRRGLMLSMSTIPVYAAAIIGNLCVFVPSSIHCVGPLAAPATTICAHGRPAGAHGAPRVGRAGAQRAPAGLGYTP